MGLEENGKTEEEHSFLAGGVNSAVQKFGFFKKSNKRLGAKKKPPKDLAPTSSLGTQHRPALARAMASRTFQCPMCPYTAKDASNLGKHRQRHSTARPHACECGRAFKTTLDLKRHKRTHLECPFKCGYAADSRPALNEHVVQCPAGDGRELPPPLRIPCGLGFCTYTSTRAFCVRAHQRCMHNPALGNALACKSCDFTPSSYLELLAHVKRHERRGRRSASGPASAAAAALADELAGTEE